MTSGLWYVLHCYLPTRAHVGWSHQALEEGEDIQQLSEQARLKQGRRAAKLESGTGTPMSEGGRGRGRKGKAKMNENDFEPLNGKRKRGLNNKSMSVTPSAMDDDEEDRDMVRRLFSLIRNRFPDNREETTEDQNR